jgi:hypothetical protein
MEKDSDTALSARRVVYTVVWPALLPHPFQQRGASIASFQLPGVMSDGMSAIF